MAIAIPIPSTIIITIAITYSTVITISSSIATTIASLVTMTSTTAITITIIVPALESVACGTPRIGTDYEEIMGLRMGNIIYGSSEAICS